jgi:hypothetical protein
LPTETAGPPVSELCHGRSIAYKAFVRRFNPQSDAGIIIVMASCFFGNTGVEIFFDGFRLMQIPPVGIVAQHDTFCVASSTSLVELADPPNVVTVMDAFGSREIPVRDWGDKHGDVMAPVNGHDAVARTASLKRPPASV